MKKQFLFTDLDLTLLTTGKTISDEDLKAIKELLDSGSFFAFVTGRPFEDTLPLAVNYGLERKGVFIASFNGALISSFNGESWDTIFKEPVSYEDTRFIFEEAEKKRVHCQTYTKTHVLSLHDTDILRSYSDKKVIRPRVIEDLDLLMAELPEPPMKVVCAALNDRPKLERFRDHIEPMISDRLFCLFSSDRLLEFGKHSATKANALRFLAAHADVDLFDTVAAGDEANDISMIEAAGTGYAVNNARDEVKKAADRITKRDHDHSAIAEIIREMME